MADLHRLTKKLQLEFKPDTSDYDIHGYFVQEISQETQASKLFHKMMDARHSGAIRRVGRAKDSEELLAIWCEMRDKGAIASAYWALMTLADVTPTLRNAIFGEVHMLSHLLGTSYQQRTAEAADLRAELQSARDKLRRMEVNQAAALAERDEEIAKLREEQATLRSHLSHATAPAAEATHQAQDRHTQKRERALQSVRVRARAAEDHVKRLEGELRKQRVAVVRAPHRSTASQEAQDTQDTTALAAREAAKDGKAILYLGGHTRSVDRLRSIAHQFNCGFVHHDGGVEDASQRLDSVLPSVDCVLCPVNCISHDASLRAKRVCQSLNKPFVPLRSASQSAFRKALLEVLDL
ncbi:MAG: DUF2325 domain-containing protein [Pseudomonadota bacterium]